LGWRLCHFLIWVVFLSHSCLSPRCFLFGFSQQVISELIVRLCHRTNGLSLTLYQKSSWRMFQASVYKCVNGGTSRGCLLPLEGECTNMEEGLSLEEKIVRYSSVSSTLSIRKKTRKPNVLRFWVEGDIILLYELCSCLILVCLPMFPPRFYRYFFFLFNV